MTPLPGNRRAARIQAAVTAMWSAVNLWRDGGIPNLALSSALRHRDNGNPPDFPSGRNDERIVKCFPSRRKLLNSASAVRFDQLFSDVARDLKRLLNSTPLSDEPLHLVAS